MKKILSLILLATVCLTLIAAIVCCLYGAYDTERTLQELAGMGASGIDYLGVGWGYGICLFAISLFGLILSIIDIKLLQDKLVYIPVITTVVFVILTFMSFYFF